MTVASLLVELKHELHGKGSVVNLNVLEAALLVHILEGLIFLWIKIVVNAIGLFG